MSPELPSPYRVSIPSRGFWFFEEKMYLVNLYGDFKTEVSIPSRGFWFFEAHFQGRLRLDCRTPFQSPRGDFGFLKPISFKMHSTSRGIDVSIPSRGFWFFEVDIRGLVRV